jgi:beta-glucanase (GH16 family)
MISTGGIDKPAFSFLYGYAEARIKLPRGAGMWPAFWLIPSNFTWPPEIDIMEWQGVVPQQDLVTIHWGASSSPQQYGTAVNTGTKLYAGYHVYGVDWEPSYVTWYFDGKPVMTFTNRSEIPHQPMFVILNLAIGGWYPGQLKPSPRSFPATMSVDYVRIWNKRPTKSATPPT